MKIEISKKQIPYIILILFGILIFFMGILNHYLFKTVAHDYGNYNFAFWDYSHFRISDIPTFRGNFLQDHFSFTLMYFIPVFWLLNWLTGTYTLILIQCSLIILAAWYSYKIIKLQSDNIWLGTGVLIYYFTLLGRYTSFSADVNLAVMSSCFIPVFIYYFQTKKYIISFVILILSLLSRENIPLWFIFIFIVLIIERRHEKKAIILSLAGMVISLVYFILLFKIIIPSVESEETGYALFNYSALGKSPGEALLFIVKNPFESMKLFFINHLDDPAYDYVKAEFYLIYLISGGFVLLLRPQFIIWFIPIVAQKVLNDSYIRWGIASYYSIEVVALLPLSVFTVLSRISNVKLAKGLAVIVCLATISATLIKLQKANNQVPWTLNPSKVNVCHKSFYKAPFKINEVNKLLKQIPANAKISASNIILPHLAQRQNIYFFPEIKDAEYIIFSVTDNNYIFSHQYNEDSRNRIIEDPKWEIAGIEYPVFLFKYNESPANSKSGFERLFQKSDTLFCDYENTDTLKEHLIFSNGTYAENNKRITDSISHSPDKSLVLNSDNPFSSSVKISDSDDIWHLQISVWCHRSEKMANVVASRGENFYLSSNEIKETDCLGWGKITLDFWMPYMKESGDLQIYLWNNSQQAVYFDDLKIVKYFRKPE